MEDTMTAEETMPRRILVMVQELHRMGYERLRLAPPTDPTAVTANWEVSFSMDAARCR
jgi:hypothetical protein